MQTGCGDWKRCPPRGRFAAGPEMMPWCASCLLTGQAPCVASVPHGDLCRSVLLCSRCCPACLMNAFTPPPHQEGQTKTPPATSTAARSVSLALASPPGWRDVSRGFLVLVAPRNSHPQSPSCVPRPRYHTQSDAAVTGPQVFCPSSIPAHSGSISFPRFGLPRGKWTHPRRPSSFPCLR